METSRKLPCICTVSSKEDHQLTITRVVFRVHPGGNAFTGDPRVTYEVRFAEEQSIAKVTAEGSSVTYPVDWQLDEKLRRVQASLRANLVIPAKTSAILRFYSSTRRRTAKLAFVTQQKPVRPRSIAVTIDLG
jgi:hypothetical protein